MLILFISTKKKTLLSFCQNGPSTFEFSLRNVKTQVLEVRLKNYSSAHLQPRLHMASRIESDLRDQTHKATGELFTGTFLLVLNRRINRVKGF